MINESADAYKKLEDTLQLYQDIIYSSPSMIALLKGEEMIIELANDALVESWGKGKDIIGKSIFVILPEIIDQGYRDILSKVYTTGKPYYAYEVPVNLIRNGLLNTFYYTFIYQAQHGANGDIEGVVIIANEVSLQVLLKMQIQESEAHFRMIAEVMSEKVTIATPDGEVFYHNKSWQEYTGKTKEELLQKGWANWIHPDDVENTKNNWIESVKSGSDFNMELRMLDSKGQYRWHTSKARAVKDEGGKIKLWIGFNADIHYQKLKTQSLENSVFEQNLELVKINKALSLNNKELERKNKEIEDSKEKLLSGYSRSLIEASHDPMIVISPKGKITDVNQATVIVTDVERTKLLGTDFYNYFTEPEKAKQIYKEVFLKGFVTDYPLTIKDHVLTPVLFNGSVYKGEDGKEVGAVVVARDITEHQKNQQILQATLIELSNYKYALDASSIVEVTDSNGIMNYVNENFCNISQYTSEELLGNTHQMVNSGYHSKELMQDLWKTISSGKIWRDEIKNKAKDGTFYWVLTTIVPFNDNLGKPYQYVAIRTDITEQKKIEKELIKAKELAELSTSIAEIAQGKAEDAAKSKQQFLSNMSHEIRTPMNAIIGFTKVLLKTGLTDKQMEYLSAIKQSGDALIVLINDILDLAKVESGKMSFESIPFKLSVSIASMTQLFETKIQEKNLKFIKEYDQTIPEVLLGDPIRLHQIILNLLSNAVKFTTDGSISLSVRLVEENEQSVSIEFAIKDTGIGIAENKKDKIFENFQQASSSTSRIFGGTGLGLSIVKQLVEPQGGTVKLESELNVGSRFSFVLKFGKTTEKAETQDEIMKLDSEFKEMRVLVVEDMPLNQLLMRTVLDEFGFNSEIVFNGKLAIEKMKNANFDIILMDLQMPEMNGFEATKYIREVLKSEVPIIALTADVTTVDLEKCKAVGMNDYVAKPVDERLLYNKIVSLIKKVELNKPKVTEKIKYTDLTYLIQKTKSEPALLLEMITLYLKQTPPLVHSMKQSLKSKDWAMLGSVVHKMIPSFSIMGINLDYERTAKKIQEYAVSQQLSHDIDNWVLQIETACGQSCEELKEELERLNHLDNPFDSATKN